MFEILKLIVIFLSFNNYRSTAEILKCSFVEEQWSHAPELYGCDVSNDIFTTKTQIDSVDGNHKTGKTNNDVKSILFHNNAKNTQYIPQGIEKFFPNLQQISIHSNSQKFNEIHQEDLKLFPKLKYLDLGYDLKVLEKDLFKFNPDLEVIYLSGNQISHIDANVFSALENLNFLILSKNKCSTALVNAYTISEVKKVVKKVEELKCVDTSYLFAEVNELNFIVKSLTDLTKKLKNRETELNNENQKIAVENAELKQKLIDKSEDSTSQELSLKELNDKVITTKQENAKLLEDLKNKSYQLETFKSSMVQTQVEIKTCQINTVALEHEIRDKANVIDNFVSEKVVQNNTFRDMRMDINKFKVSMRESNLELSDALSNITAQLRQNEIKNRQEIADIKREVFTKCQNQNCTPVQRDSVGFESLNSFLQQGYSEIQTYQKNLQTMKNEINNNEFVIENLLRENAKCTDVVHEMRIKITNNQCHNEDQSELNAQLNECSRSTSEMKSKFESHTKELNTNVSVLESKLYQCSFSTSDLEQKYQKCRHFVSELKGIVLDNSKS